MRQMARTNVELDMRVVKKALALTRLRTKKEVTILLGALTMISSRVY